MLESLRGSRKGGVYPEDEVKVNDSPIVPLQPRGVEYPKRPSEFDVQVKLYLCLCRLRFKLNLPLEVYGEVQAGNGEQSIGRNARLDLVVFVNKKAVLAFEVKRYPLRRICQRPVLRRQIGRYADLTGIPILACCGFNDVDRAVAEAESLLMEL